MREYQRQMVASFNESGVNTPRQVDIGLAKARAQSAPFLPSPGQFCEWCKPDAKDYGLPSIDQAFQEARKEAYHSQDSRKWSHPAVYKAAHDIGFFQLKSVQDDKIPQLRDLKMRFGEIYQGYIDKVIAGERFDYPESKRLELKKPIFLTKGAPQAESALSNMRGMFNE